MVPGAYEWNLQVGYQYRAAVEPLLQLRSLFQRDLRHGVSPGLWC